ncbi:DNA-binding protein [Corynebacterium sp. LK19]|uniref:septation protein SepH n=1 Tax=unclassified Corynebacterium TaxID=2624378 RepID=UPI0011C920A5|nr:MULTISPECIES: septation protein SepH [unclassified Corynebacterium]MBC6746722.1 DNA-binding protein [Corynebacterium sp. LK25]TXS60781.1 DNA-binding protein [Corynebacterium sp. LK19]TXS84689.1 DNA-binding protein [Corynebacterium sp. LK10]
MRELKPVLDGDVTDSLILVPADITEQERQEGLRFTLPLDENLRTFLVEHFELADAAGSPAAADSASLADGSSAATATASGSSGESATAERGSTDGSSTSDSTAEATTASGDAAEGNETTGNSATAGGAPKKTPTAPKPVLEEPRVVLSPREIQDRIRSGQTVEELIEYSGMQPRKIESFAYPVLAERARIAELGKQSKPRRIDGPAKLSLWEILATAFAARGQELADASWDAYRDPSGQWIVTVTWNVGHTTNVAEWSYQAEGLSALTIARNELAAELIDPDFARRNRDLAPQANRAADTADTSEMPAAWQSSAEPQRGHGEQDVPSQSDAADDDIDEAEFLQHPDVEQPKRKKKTVMPSWEDVLLGVRPNGPKK